VWAQFSAAVSNVLARSAMANHFLDGPAVQPPQINAVVDHYLASLARDLPGPRGARAAALDEVRDGLHEPLPGTPPAAYPHSWRPGPR